LNKICGIDSFLPPLFLKLKMSDITIHIIDRDQKKHSLIVPIDMNMNLMEACKSYEFPVEGICGGMAMCASCQVYVGSKNLLENISEEEKAMLSEAFHIKPNSRLGCQIPMTADLDGLEFEIAPE
jgi:2Fe-2S ferredoxin